MPNIDAGPLVTVKVEPSLGEQIKRIRSAHVLAVKERRGRCQKQLFSLLKNKATYLTLKRKLNCQVHACPWGGKLPSPSQMVIPSWINLRRSTLHLSV